MCAKQVACGSDTQARCESGGVLYDEAFTDACVDAYVAASCAALPQFLLSNPVCSPQCPASYGKHHCNAAQTELTICDSLGSFVYSCERFCRQAKQTYSGVCGTSFNGKTEPDPWCWCQ